MTTIFKKLLITLLIFGCTQLTFAQTYNIDDFGAVKNSSTINTKAIQRAVDKCTANGGGMVYVPAGTYLTGTIRLKSNVNLHLETGAVLKGSAVLTDYESYELPKYGKNYYGMLYTEKAKNVSITGFGEIDGNEKSYFIWNEAKKIDTASTRYTRQKSEFRKVDSGIGDGPVVPKDRTRQMVIFAQCENVTVANIGLMNATFWTMHFADCDAVNVTGIRLFSNLLAPNADGIDISSCSNVQITNCDIRTGDDAIAIVGYDHHFEIPGFSGIKKDCENIIIANCNLQSASSGIRIGFLDQNNVRNIQVSNVNITNSTRGIGIFVRDQGSIENVTFSNIFIQTKLRTGDWWGNGEPIHLSAIRGNDGVKLGQIKNIKFNHIICEGEAGILVYGTKESMIENVTFNDIDFKIVTGKLNAVAGGNIDLRGVNGVENGLFARDLPGLLAQHVKQLAITNFKLSWPSQPASYFTHGIEASDFESLSIKNFQGIAAPGKNKVYPVFLKNGTSFTSDLSKAEVKKENVKE